MTRVLGRKKLYQNIFYLPQAASLAVKKDDSSNDDNNGGANTRQSQQKKLLMVVVVTIMIANILVVCHGFKDKLTIILFKTLIIDIILI